MNTTRSIIRTDPESDRFVKVDGESLTIWLENNEYVNFGVSHNFSTLENINCIIELLTAVKGDLEKLQ